MRTSPACSCCNCPVRVGQPEALQSYLLDPSCCPNGDIQTTGLNADIAQIEDQDIVICGYTADITDYYQPFTSGNWPDVASWVSAGGKLVVFGGPTSFFSAADITDTNNFLSSIGASMALGSSSCCPTFFGDVCDQLTNATNTSLGICGASAGRVIEWMEARQTNTVSGGTWIAVTSIDCSFSVDCPGFGGAGIVFLAGEYVGNGFVMLCGCRVACPSATQWCDLLHNLYEIPANALL